jgi:hypothetical protein
VQGASFLGADAAEHTHGDVRPQAFSPGCVQHGQGLVQVERLRLPSWLSGGHGRHVPDHEVVHHRVPDGLDQDHPASLTLLVDRRLASLPSAQSTSRTFSLVSLTLRGPPGGARRRWP